MPLEADFFRRSPHLFPFNGTILDRTFGNGETYSMQILPKAVASPQPTSVANTWLGYFWAWWDERKQESDYGSLTQRYKI